MAFLEREVIFSKIVYNEIQNAALRLYGRVRQRGISLFLVYLLDTQE